MATQEVPVKANLNIVLKSDTEQLEEVMVVAYGTAKKSAFTGSAATIKNEKIATRQTSNVTNALAGQVAGVQTTSNNGQPGKDAEVRIRGIGSISASNKPLYVVDGVPYDGEISAISTSDIESMTVLKDAASTALYGARGANGIIMITTKKGTSGKARVNFDAKWGANSRGVKNYDVLTSPKNYLEKAYEAIYNGYVQTNGMAPQAANVAANNTLLSAGNGGVGYQIYTVPEGQLLIGSNGLLNPNATLGYTDEYGYYYTPDNWADETFRTALRQEYNLNVSGGNDKSTFYMAFGYLDDQGVIEGSGLTRFSGRLKGDYKVTDWLKVGANMNYVNSKSNYPGDQNNTSSSGNAFYIANNIAPVYPMYVRGADKQIMTLNGRKVYDYGDGVSSPSSRAFMSIANPAGDLIYNKTEYLADVLNANWFAELTPIKGLTISARFGMNIDNTRYNDLGNAYMGQSASYGGNAYQAAMRTFGFDQQYVANYQFAVKDVHHFDITAGYDGYSYQYTELTGSGQNLYDPESFYISNTIDKKTASGMKLTYATEGFFGRVNYSYDDKYFGNVSYRRDASSRFAPENRWGDFWAASVAWMITREDFMKDITWINMLKLKASFGQQGNDNLYYKGYTNYYPYLDQFTVSGSDGVFSDGVLYYKGSKDITWETSNSFNVGVDFALLGGRIDGTIEYFNRQTKDMLYYKPVAMSNGYTQLPMNIGSVRNSGVEIELNYTPIETNDLKWVINWNGTLMKNKILELHPDLKGEMIDGSYIYREGESLYQMYLTKYAGVDPDSGEALYWAKDENGVEYKDKDWSAAYNSNRQASGDLLPTIYGGVGTTLEFRGFDFSIQCAYQLGGTIYDSGYQAFMHGGDSHYMGYNWHKDILNAWTPENRNTNIPRVDAIDKYTNSSSDRWLTSSDYFSINNITLGYTLPKRWLRSLGIGSLRIYGAADNVALFSARKGLDPRMSYTTASTDRYTPIRTISGGLKVTF